MKTKTKTSHPPCAKTLRGKDEKLNSRGATFLASNKRGHFSTPAHADIDDPVITEETGLPLSQKPSCPDQLIN